MVKTKKQKVSPVAAKYDVLEEIFAPQKKAAKALEEHKKRKTPKTKPVYASHYGFKSSMILYVRPETTREQIIEKFTERLKGVDLCVFKK